MSTSEKIGAVLLLAFCVMWGSAFGYLVCVMPDYGTGVFSH